MDEQAGRKQQTNRAAAAEQARERLLEAGRQMVHEQPVNAGLDHIKVTEVARRAEMTTGAIYHHWESQDAYRAELMDSLLAPISLQDSELLAGALDAVLAGQVTIAELIGLVAWDNLTQLTDNDQFNVQVGFWSRRSDPEIARRITSSYRELAERRSASIEQFLRAFGRQMRAPITAAHLSTMFTALAEGLAIRLAVEPEAVPLGFPVLSAERPVVERLRELAHGRYPDETGDAADGLNLLATAAGALIEQLTEPRSDD